MLLRSLSLLSLFLFNDHKEWSGDLTSVLLAVSAHHRFLFGQCLLDASVIAINPTTTHNLEVMELPMLFYVTLAFLGSTLSPVIDG